MNNDQLDEQQIDTVIEEGIEENVDLMNTRNHSTFVKNVIKWIAIIWSVFQIYTAAFGLMPALIQRSIALGFGFTLAFALYKTKYLKNDESKIPLTDIILIGLGILCTGYIVVNFEALAYRAGLPSTGDIVFGIITILLLVEATRRVVGWPLVFVAMAFVLYGYFGPYMPLGLGHRGYGIPRIADHLYAGTEGIFGIPMYVMSTYIYAFILFGAFLEATGGTKLFINLAYSLTGASRGGPAKTAVVASGLMGTISGSSLANVVTTGNFTIPLMKKVGYTGSFSAGVEAASSSGGQIMPPIMGAAAFIMAEMTGIPYVTIIKAAILPAVLYFISLYTMVHLEAHKLNLKATERKNLPKVGDALKRSLPLIVPIFTIIYLLMTGYSPLRAALYSILAMLILSTLRKETRLNISSILKALEKAAYNAVTVTIACAICGIIIGIVSLTGLGLTLAQAILTISQGNLLATMFLTMIASILLGLGLPTTAKYIVCATIAAPALVALGVPVIAAHLFILYFGVIAEVTPPVALTSYAAAGVANSDGMTTAVHGLKLASAGFLVPYVFVYNHNLLLLDVTLGSMLITAVTSIAGVVCLAAGVSGYFLVHCKWYERILFLSAAIALIFHGLSTDIFGVAVVIVIFFLQRKRDAESADELVNNFNANLL